MRIAFLLLFACGSSVPVSLAVGPRVVLHEDDVENAYPRLSRDGREILYQSNRTGSWQVYVLDLASNTSRALTTQGNNNLPDWSPDGQRIAFVSDRDGNEEIYVSARDGSEPRRLTDHPDRDLHPYWSPDGKTLLYNSLRDGAFDVFEIEVATGTQRRLTTTPQSETCARYAPDGKRIVMLRNDTTMDDVILVDGDEKNLTATPQIRDGWPMFGPDGWIYFAGMDTGDFAIYRIKPGGPKEKLTSPAKGEEDARPFISADGKRLIFNRKREKTIDILELALG